MRACTGWKLKATGGCLCILCACNEDATRFAHGPRNMISLEIPPRPRFHFAIFPWYSLGFLFARDYCIPNECSLRSWIIIFKRRSALSKLRHTVAVSNKYQPSIVHRKGEGRRFVELRDKNRELSFLCSVDFVESEGSPHGRAIVLISNNVCPSLKNE